MKVFIAFLMLAFASVPLQTASASCQGRFEGTQRAGAGEYDPFDAVDFRQRQTVVVRNTGTAKCDFIVGFRRQPAVGHLSWFLSYRLEDTAGQSLLSEQVPSGSQYLILANVQPSQTATGEYYLVLPRGQFALPGTYRDDNVTLSLRPRDQSGNIGAELDGEGLAVAQAVGARVGISIAGGGLATTLNFGELAAGLERSISLQARANYAYSITLRSSNAGVMKLDPEIPGQTWSIPYSLRVNSQAVQLQGVVKILRALPWSSWGQESHWLTFRIEDVNARHAGIYRDVVIVSVNIEL
jgi:hypothetical protein